MIGENVDATCRSCGLSELKSVLSLGDTPLADALVSKEDINGPEASYPLDVAFCTNCALMQILETVPPEELFCRDYPYFSSVSDTVVNNARENTEHLMATRGLDSDSLVIELASNDGYLLQNYVKAGIPVLGIDPADTVVKAALEKGVPTMERFFGRELAEELAAEGKKADVIHGNNVLAHVADLNGFVDGIRIALKDDGVAVIEVPYVRDLIDHTEFDTIYHEHLCYFSVTALTNLFRARGLHLNDVKRLPIHGGSLRLFIEKGEAPTAYLKQVLAEEKELGIDEFEYYRNFGQKVETLISGLRDLLGGLKSDGKRIAAYGAAAKGATMLNCSGIGTEYLDYVVDRNVHKQGLHMPGVHVPIEAPEKLVDDMPDYVLLLAWNFKDEVLGQQAQFREKGGKFVIPVPEPQVV